MTIDFQNPLGVVLFKTKSCFLFSTNEHNQSATLNSSHFFDQLVYAPHFATKANYQITAGFTFSMLQG